MYSLNKFPGLIQYNASALAAAKAETGQQTKKLFYIGKGIPKRKQLFGKIEKTDEESDEINE